MSGAFVVLASLAFAHAAEGPMRRPVSLSLPAEREAFEVVSIRRAAPPALGGRIGGPGGPGVGPCPPATPRVDPRRFTVPNVTLLRLIAWAYGLKDCRPESGLLSGGPDWMSAVRWDVEAIIPEGTPVYGRLRFTNGNAPKLQTMLQTLLADRFKLAVHREMKDMPVYNLVVAKPGRMVLSPDQSPPPDPFGTANGIRLGPGGVPPRGVTLMGNGFFQGTSIPMSTLTQLFQARLDHPIIDKTGLKGLFDIRVPVEFNPTTDTDFQIRDYLGLKLEPARAVVEVLVIERAEKPSQN